MARLRIDAWLVKQGRARSRAEAAEMVEAGRVFRNGLPIAKPATQVSPEDTIEIDAALAPAFVGRGAEKIQSAFEHWGLRVAADWYADIGASTGGFTDYLLSAGARGVVAVDVGHHQLHEKLRADPRVVALEDTHILSLESWPDGRLIHRAVMDLSFISLKKVFPHVWTLLTPPKWCLALFKPQFEVGRAHVARGGVVKDERAAAAALDDFVDWLNAAAPTAAAARVLPCALKGRKKGNQEYWVLIAEPPADL